MNFPNAQYFTGELWFALKEFKDEPGYKAFLKKNYLPLNELMDPIDLIPSAPDLMHGITLA